MKPIFLCFTRIQYKIHGKCFLPAGKNIAKKKMLSPLEMQIAEVILHHPEYQPIIEQIPQVHEQAYHPELGETNPFLHMGLHLAVREQTNTNRPAGIATIYKNLVKKYKDPLAVEHIMMEQLAECLWLAQKNNQIPDEQQYLTRLNSLT